jgi:DNA polymerase-3 subunit delta'
VTEQRDIPTVSAPLPWQTEAWSRLQQQLSDGQLPHALLITGPQYTGKSRLALALARLLLCARPAAGLNCGTCHPCELSASGNHGDFRRLEPEGKSRLIKIDQIRSLVEFAVKTAGFGLCKLVLISPAENMNTSAANALLKVLEEPPANTYLILVSHRLHGLPATVRSRCQLLRLSVPPQDQSLSWLDQTTGNHGESRKLLEMARGKPLLAAQLYADGSGERWDAARQSLQGMFTANSGIGPLAAALAGDEMQQALARLVDGLQAGLSTLGAAALGSPKGRAAFGLLDEITQIQRAVNAGSNPNQQLLLDALLGKVQRVLGEGRVGDNIDANYRAASYERRKTQ